MNIQADQQIDQLIARHEASWRLGYDVFPALLNRLGLKRGAEIGVAFGGHSEAILHNTSVTRLYAIDSYQHRPEYDDPMNLPQAVFDRLYERTGERLSVFGRRVQQVRLDSVQAAQVINEPLDFVYIDGDHSYEGIRADMEAWFPLIREGGIIAGHDYGQPAFPGVKAAADHFFKRFGLTVQHEGKGIWWAQRPATNVTVVIATSTADFCDVTLYDQLIATGLTKRDTLILAHDTQHACDAASRVLAAHPRVIVQPVEDLRGPWHAATQVIDHINTPMLLAIDLNTPLAKDAIRGLRDRLCTSGAIAAAFTGGPSTNDFALADLLANTTMPSHPTMVMTSTVKQACHAMPFAIAKASDRLIPWLVLADGLASGGRVALQTGLATSQLAAWSPSDCRIAAEVLARHAPLIDGTDLLRLKWPTVASQWLNTLDNKPVRTRVNVRPIDVPPTFQTPRFLDRVVHKVRRTLGRAA